MTQVFGQGKADVRLYPYFAAVSLVTSTGDSFVKPHTQYDLRPHSKPLTLSKPSSTTSFKLQKFYILPTKCVCVFCTDLTTNSDYFLIQQKLTGFYNLD